jgi:hypothetical protein
MSNQDYIASQMREETDSSPSEAGIGRSRILARQLARPLTAAEIDVVTGAAMRVAGGAAPGALRVAGGTCSGGTCCVPDCDD